MAPHSKTLAQWEACYKSFVKARTGKQRVRIKTKEHPWVKEKILLYDGEGEADADAWFDAADVLNSAVVQQHILAAVLGDAARSTEEKTHAVLEVRLVKQPGSISNSMAGLTAAAAACVHLHFNQLPAVYVAGCCA